jgi:hypothetical protein
VAVVRVDAAGGDDACAVEAADVRHERLAALDDRVGSQYTPSSVQVRSSTVRRPSSLGESQAAT